MTFLKRLLLLFVVFAPTQLRAQLPGPFPGRETPFPNRQSVINSCSPSGNVEEVPFDAHSIPIAEWLKNPRDVREIPWAVSVRDPQLQEDQRTAVMYQGTLDMRKLKPRDADRKLVFVAGVNDSDGHPLLEPAVHAVDLATVGSKDADIGLRGCVYFRPGSYTLWLAVYDEASGKHSLTRRNVRLAEIKNDPLPKIESLLPAARFPEYTEESSGVSRVLPEAMFLPVANKRPLIVDLIGISPAPADVLGLLAQLGLQDGSISVTALDLEKQKVVFESDDDAGKLDFVKLLQTTDDDLQDNSVDVHVLQVDRNRGVFFRNFLEQKLRNSGGKFRVVILLSSPLSFPRGSDLSEIRAAQNCECRVFQLQFSRGFSDELGKMLKPLKPQRFEIDTPLELRKAIAEIIRELEELRY